MLSQNCFFFGLARVGEKQYKYLLFMYIYVIYEGFGWLIL